MNTQNQTCGCNCGPTCNCETCNCGCGSGCNCQPCGCQTTPVQSGCGCQPAK